MFLFLSALQEEENAAELCQDMANITIASQTSLYIPEDTGNTSSDSSDSKEVEREQQFFCRQKLNKFLVASGKEAIGQPKKAWVQLS